MPDPTTFESRLTDALVSYADQVPTEVDALAFVHATRGASPGMGRSLLAAVETTLRWRASAPWRITRVTAFFPLAAAIALAAIVAVGPLGLVHLTATPAAGLPPTACPGPLESGFIATIAGTGQAGWSSDGGPAIEAAIIPSGIAVDSDGNVYFSEVGWIRRIGTDGILTTVASAATGADLVGPRDLAFDREGTLHASDYGAGRIWRVEDDGSTTTVAGTGRSGIGGNEGPAIEADVRPIGLAFGPQGDFYFYDLRDYRRVDADGVIHAFAGDLRSGVGGDGGAAIESPYSRWIRGIATDDVGNVFLGDLTDKRIYKVDAAGTITTVAGTGESGPWKDGVPAVNANLSDSIVGIALDADGSLYFSEQSANAVRKIDPAGIVTTVTGGPGELGDCGPAAKASIREPHGLTLRDGVLYIAEPDRIRMVVL